MMFDPLFCVGLQKYLCPEGSVCAESTAEFQIYCERCTVNADIKKSIREACEKSKRLLVGWILLKGMI
jgi:enhancing lycopene biosynthesis protein 2